MTTIKTHAILDKLLFGAFVACATCIAHGATMERGDTLVYLSFDDTVDSVGAATGSTTVYSGTPAYAVDRPFANVYWRVDGDVQQSRVNTKSLYANGNRIQLKFPTATFPEIYGLKDATVEFFFKGVSLSNTWGTFVRFTKYGDPPFPFIFQTDSSNYDYFRADCPKSSGQESISIYSGKPFADNTWHHFAMTVTETASGKSEINFYYDYSLIKTGTSAEGVWECLLDNNMSIDFGSSYGVCYIDEFRISKGALSVHEFLRGPVPQDGDAIFHLTFDNAMSNAANEQVFVQPIVTGATPVYEAESLPGATIYAQAKNGERTLTSRANVGALYCSNTTVSVTWPGILAEDFRRPNLSYATIEFFIKCDVATDAWKNPIYAHNRNVGNIPPFPFLAQYTDQGKLSLRLDCSDDNFSTSQTQGDRLRTLSANMNYSFADGQWHHLAVSVEPNGDGSCMKFYCDHKLTKTMLSTDYAWKGFADFHLFDFGTTGVKCWIDEFRITKGVLTPYEFLNTCAPPAEREELIYMSFDGDMSSSARADCRPTSVSGTPQYAARGFSRNIGTSFGSVTTNRTNGGALYVDNTITIQLPDSPWIADEYLTAATVEFFVKGSSTARRDWQCPILFKHNINTSQQPIPLLAQTSETGLLRVQFQSFDYTENTIWSIADYETRRSADLFDFNDACWHHIAVTIAPSGEGMSTYTWYCDGNQVGQSTTERFSWKGLTGMRQIAFVGSSEFSYCIDELRICKGVLSPSEFIHKAPSEMGFVLTFH